VQILKLKLEQAEQQLESEPDSPEVIDNEPDNMKNIIARLVTLCVMTSMTNLNFTIIFQVDVCGR